MLKGSSDYFGINFYTGRMTAEPRTTRLLAALPSLARMGRGEPFGLLGVLSQAWTTKRLKEGPGNYFEDIYALPSFRWSWVTTAMTWPLVPWALARILVYISETYNPAGGIYITENGVAVSGEDDVKDACDTRPGKPGAQRIAHLRSHLTAVQKAIARGADVRGYFLWSFMDNFEWAFGYAKRFGLIHVDYQTLVRTPKPVAQAYRAIIEANGVRPNDAKEAALDPFALEALDSRVAQW